MSASYEEGKLLEEGSELDDHDQVSGSVRGHAPHSFCSIAFKIQLLIIVGLLTTVLWIQGHPDFYDKQHGAHNQTNLKLEYQEGSSWQDCGSNADEARHRGCVFDVILVAWLPADCFDSELMETYLSDISYPFWIDRKLQRSISLDEVRLGKHPTVFSSSEFHLAHCAYFLEQSIRGFRDRLFIDNVTLDDEHTAHCARSLRDHWLPELGYSPLHMAYHSCGKR